MVGSETYKIDYERLKDDHASGGQQVRARKSILNIATIFCNKCSTIFDFVVHELGDSSEPDRTE